LVTHRSKDSSKSKLDLEKSRYDDDIPLVAVRMLESSDTKPTKPKPSPKPTYSIPYEPQNHYYELISNRKKLKHNTKWNRNKNNTSNTPVKLEPIKCQACNHKKGI
jgi:hypothetical protein